MIDVKVTFFFLFFFKCLNATVPLTCMLANEYPSSNEISKIFVVVALLFYVKHLRSCRDGQLT